MPHEAAKICMNNNKQINIAIVLHILEANPLHSVWELLAFVHIERSDVKLTDILVYQLIFCIGWKCN